MVLDFSDILSAIFVSLFTFLPGLSVLMLSIGPRRETSYLGVLSILLDFILLNIVIETTKIEFSSMRLVVVVLLLTILAYSLWYVIKCFSEIRKQKEVNNNKQ